MDGVDGAWRTMNRLKPRILVYTDSRGMNVSSKTMAVTKHHYGSHVDALQRRYHVHHCVCPFSHTTLVDFLTFLDDTASGDFDAVILQCGIVDFSPRPLSSIDKIRSAKAGVSRFDELFAANKKHYAEFRGEPYEGEETTTLYSMEFARRVADELAQIENLIWISSNDFVPGWNGNWRPRPADINTTVRGYDEILLGKLSRTLNLHRWTHEEVQARTVDNIHFTRAGFKALRHEIVATLGDLAHADAR